MAIKISGSTIIDDSRVIVNADKIGIGTPSPTRELSILSSNPNPTGIGVSAANLQSTGVNKAISVFNAGITSTFSVSYTGIVTANEYFGTFKGTIDTGAAIDNANKIKINHTASNNFFNVPFFSTGLSDGAYGDIRYDNSQSLQYNPLLGNLRINSGAGNTALIIRTTSNELDRAIAFQNSGLAYVGAFGFVDRGVNQADLAFFTGNANNNLGTLSETMRLTKESTVGIGTTRPDGLLHVFGGDAIVTGGSVGIGTTIPETKLHISGTGQNGIRIDTDALGLSFHNHSEFMGFMGNDSGKLFINAGGTQDTLLLRTGGAERISILSDGNVGIGTDSTGGARLRVYKDNALSGDDRSVLLQQWRGSLGSTGERALNLYSPSTDSTNDYYRFQTGNAFKFQVDSIDALCINSSGLVGIGTGDIKSQLHVESATGTATTIIISQEKTYGVGSGTAERARLDLAIREVSHAANNRVFGRIETGPESETTSQRSFLAFSTRNSGTISERLRITSEGDVGINSTAPETKLDVIMSSANRTWTPGTSVVSMFERSGNNRIIIVSGSNSVGQIDFGDTNDDNAGYIRYHHRDDSMSFRVDRAEKLRITSDGDVGIGTTIPTGTNALTNNTTTLAVGIVTANEYFGTFKGTIDPETAADRIEKGNTKAQVVDTGSDGHFLVETEGTERLRISSTGRVAIGTDNPIYRLEVLEDGGLTSTIGSASTIVRFTNKSGTGSNGDLNLTIYDKKISLVGTENWRGTEKRIEYNVDDNANKRMWIGFLNETTNTSDNIIRFGEAYDTEWMRIDNGNVGIGSTIPAEKFVVSNDAGNVTSLVEAIAGDALLNLSNSGNGNYSGINFTRERGNNQTGRVGGSIFMPSNTSNNEAFLYIQTQSANADAGDTDPLDPNNGVRLKLHGDDGIFSIETGDSERLRVAADGNVGIGTTIPADILHIHSSGPGIRFSDSGNLGDDNPNPSPYAFAYFDANAANAIIHADKGNDVNDSRVAFAVDNSEKVRISSGGSLFVGVTTTSDNEKFVVDGNAKIEGALTLHKNNPTISLSDSDDNPDYQIGNINGALRFQDTTSNATRLIVDTTGNIGVNSANPAAKLDIFKVYNGLGVGNAAARIYGTDSAVAETGIRFVEKGTNLHDSSTAYLMRGISDGTTQFVFGANGNVGIGSTIPSVKLDVNGDIRVSSKIQLRELPGGSFLDFDDDNSAVPFPGGTNNVTLASISGMNLIYDTNNNDNNGFIIAHGNPNSGIATAVMVIDENDRVGIGTENPDASLHILSDANNVLQIESTDRHSTLYLIDSVGSSFIQNDSGNLRFGTGGGASAAGGETEAVRITTAGDVGIGTHNPTGTNALTNNNTTLAVGILTATQIYGIVEGTLRPTGDLDVNGTVTAVSFESTVAAGTPPFVVASDTKVTNLNADLLDGKSTADSKVGNSVVTRNAAGGFSAGDVTFDNIVGASATFTGNVSIAGTLTYEDVTNVDSIGIITARDKIKLIAAEGQIEATGVTGLTLNASDSSAYARIRVAGDTRLHIKSDGKVGIGTGNPDQKLHVYNGSGDVTSLVEAIEGDAILDISNTGNGNFSGINFTRQRSTGSVIGGSISMPSDTSSNQALLFIQTQSANAGVGKTGELSDNNGVRLKLASQPNGITPDTAFTVEMGSSEAFRIDNSGNVGIGTSIPTGVNAVAGNTAKLAVGIVTASEYFGTFKGTIDSGVTIENANKIQVNTSSTDSDFTIPFISTAATNDSYQALLIDSNQTTSLRFNASDGRLQINGTGRDLLTIRTTNNNADRAIAFQNSGNSYVGALGFVNRGEHQADLAFFTGSLNATLSNVTETMRLTKESTVGIGTTRPDGLLHVFGGDAIVTGGRVGIGTTRPEELLDVYKTTNDAQIKVRTTAAGAYFEADSAAATGYHGIKLSSSGTDKWFLGSYNSANFQIKDGSAASGDERFTIQDGTGKVGIGTGNPQEELHISNSNPSIRLQHDTGTNVFSQILQNGANLKVRLRNDSSNGGMHIQGNDGTDITTFIRVLNTGDVGIGTNNPTDAVTSDNTAKLAVGIVTANEYFGTFKGTIDSGVAIENANNVNITNDEDIGNTAHYIHFGDATSGYDGVKVDSTGLVYKDSQFGLGTASPGASLHISTTLPRIRFTDTNDSNIDHFISGSGSALHLQADENQEDGATATTIRFSIDADEKMRINASGQVGIGTNNPLQKLNVYNGTSSDTGGILVQNVSYGANQDKPYLIVGTKNWTGGTTNWNTFGFQHKIKVNHLGVPRVTIDGVNGEYFCVDNGGKVGIGTIIPVAKLDVRGGAISATFENNVGIGSTIPTAKLDLIGNTKFQGDVSLTRGTTRDTLTRTLSIGGARNQGNNFAAIELKNYDSDSTPVVDYVAAKITGTVPPNPNNGGELVFYTSPTGGDPAGITIQERLRITAGGNVGIGTDNPLGTNAVANNNKTLAVGILTANQIFGPVTGALTPTGNVNISNDLDVDGATTLDGLTVSEAAVFQNNLTTNGMLTISNDAPILKFNEVDNTKAYFIVGDSNSLSVRMDATGGGNIIQKWNSDGTHSFYNTVTFNNDIDVDGTANLDDVDIDGDLDVDGLTNLDHINIAGITTIDAGAFAGGNISTGGRSIQSAVDIRSDSLRGGIVVRNKNNFREETSNAGFQVLDPYDSSDTSFAFRAAEGTTLVDNFWVKTSGDGYFSGNVGIGTSVPNQKLHIEHDSFHQILLKRVGAHPSEAIFSNAGSYTNISNNSTGIRFLTGGSPISAMVIRSDRNVGIGTDNAISINALTDNNATLAVGIVTANEVYGTFKGTIDSGVAIENANKIQVNTNSTNSDFTIPFVDSTASNDSYQALLIDGDVTTSLRFNASDGRLQINGSGRDLLTIRTTSNTADRAIAFQNSGSNYVGAFGFVDRGVNQADLAFFTGNANVTLNNIIETMRLTKERTVGIGTTRPDGLLHVFGGDAIVTGGNVGIGTINPGELLVAYKTSNDAQIKVRTTTAGAYFEADSASSGYHGIKLSSVGTQKWFLGSYNSANFQIKDGSAASGDERFTIQDGTGKVGIGTVIPASMLHIHASQPRLTMSDSDTGAHHRINADSGAGNLAFDIDYNSNTSTPAFIVNIKGDEKFRVTSAADVGIGTFNPTGTDALTNNNTTLAVGIVTASEVYGTFKGTIDSDVAITNANKIKTIREQNNTSYYLTFVDSNNTSGDHYEELHTDGQISYNPVENELTVNKVLSNALIAGQGTGSVAMTVNDGYGNANIAFNHRNGTPDINGSSGRIEVGVDTNATYPHGELATMVFELYPQVTAGSPTGGAGTNKVLEFAKHSTPTDSNTFIKFHQDIIPSAHNTFDFGRNGNRIATGYFTSIGADVGIGTNDPDQTLHVYKGSAGTVTSDTNAVLTVENSDASIIQMLSPADKSNRIMFGNPGGGSSIGQIIYDNSDNHLSFNVNGGDKLIIDDNGHLLRGTSGQNIGESSSRWNDIFATNGDFSGDLTVGGTLTYEDVTNIESVGIITAKDGIHVTGAGVSVAGISTFLDKVGVGNTSPNATLEVNGPIKTNSGSYTTPRRLISSTAGDIRTDVALVMPTDSAIYTEHSIAGVGTYLRRLIGEFGDGVIEIGQHSTAIIKEIRAQAGDTGFFSIYNDDEEKLRVTSGGVVLQGDNAASTNLHGPQTTVGRTPRYQLHGANASTAGAALMSWSSSSGAYYSPTLYLARSGSGTTGTNSLIPASQTFGSILFSGDDGTNFVKGAMITGELDGTPGTSDMPGRLEFHTTPDGSQEPVERLRITSSGYVGVNNASPSYRLHVRETTGTARDASGNERPVGFAVTIARFTNTRIPSGGNSLNLSIYDKRINDLYSNHWAGSERRIEYNVDDNANKRMWIGFLNETSTTSDNIIRFGEKADTEWMRIDNGKVGIGSNNPSAMLEVLGQSTSTYGDGVARFKYVDTDDTGGGSPDLHYDVRFIPTGTYFKTFVTGGGTDFLIVDEDNFAGRASFAVEGNAGNIKSFTVDSTGSVGIGTANPQSVLEVAGSAAVLTITDTRNASYSVGDTLSSLAFDSDDASGSAGSSSHPRAKINLVTENKFGSKTGLSFATKSDTSHAPSEKMRITHDGHVGIGTTDPTHENALTYNNNTLAVGIVTANEYFGTFKGTIGSGIAIDKADTVKITDSSSDTSGTHYIHFGNEATTNNYDGVEVDSTGLVYMDGKIGIGTVSPDQELHVLGQIKVDAGAYARVEYARDDTNLWSVGLRDTDDFFFFRESGAGDVIFQHGNVGIGTNNPGKKLDVFGTFRVRDESGKSNLEIDGAQGVFKVFQTKSAWSSMTYNPSPILAWDFKKGPGDLMYMASGGNTPIGNQMALVISDNHGFKVGRAGYDGSDFDVSENAEHLRVTIDGNVGIGTSIPTGVNAVAGNTAKLAVGIVTASEYFGTFKGTIDSSVSQVASQVALGNDSSGDSAKRVLFSSADSGDVTIQVDTADGISYKPSDGTLSAQKFEGTIVTPAQPSITSVGTLTSLDVSGDLTVGGTLTYEDVTNIDSVGIITAQSGIHVIGIGTQMGVGTDNPQKKLHVFTALGDTSPAVPLLLERTNSNNNVVIQYKNTASSMYAGLAGSGAKGWGVGTQSNVGGASGNKFMIARSTGNVGIGTNDPDAILHIHSSGPGIRLSDSGNAGDNDPNPSAHAFAYFDANAANAIIHADKGNDVDNSRVAFAVDNDEKMRITHEGKVGIGTDLASAPPADRILTICSEEDSHNYLSIQSGSAKFSGIVFGHQTGNTTDNYRSYIRHSNVDDSLNFHTNSDATAKLSITSDGKFTLRTPGGDDSFIVQGDSFTNIVAKGARDSVGEKGMFQMNSSRGTNTSPVIVNDGDIIGTLSARGWDGNSFAQSSNIHFLVDGAPGDGDMPGAIMFATSVDGAEAPGEKFRITSTGALAVGGAANYGTSGQVLTSNGNAAPSWQDAGGGSDKFTVESTTGGYTLVAGDSGKLKTVTGAVTIPDNVFEQGDVITVYNNSGATISLTEGSGATVRLAGSSIEGTRQLAQRGLATIICVVDGGGSNDEFLLLGAGVV